MGPPPLQEAGDGDAAAHPDSIRLAGAQSLTSSMTGCLSLTIFDPYWDPNQLFSIMSCIRPNVSEL